ncbi:MAG: carboxymuconolactone decarboxylase family protein [Candidatus Latescibacterota bacterium]|nr:MAG: carboxymuconolactone decarboxylase family protein [Candidatus Latescibacterota bacterium]
MAWIRTIPPDQAQGKLAAEYRRGVARAGKVYQILQIQSLAPEALSASMRLYVATVRGRSTLQRSERELLALVVSRANECFY